MLENGPKACDAPIIQEIELQEVAVKAINLLISRSVAMKEKISENIATAIANYNSGDLKEINKILIAKKRELVKLTHVKKDYNDLADEIDKICERSKGFLLQRLKLKVTRRELKSCRISSMKPIWS